MTLVDGEPRQVFTAQQFRLAQVDLSLCRDDECATEVARLIREETRRPFDLARDLLLRALLIRLSPEEHLLLTVHHHIASDAWLASLFDRELGAFYRAFVQDRVPSLAELLLPLIVGARVVIVKSDVAADGQRLAAQLKSSGATMMQATPAGQVVLN